MTLISLDLNQARQIATTFQLSGQSIDDLYAHLQSQWARLATTWEGSSKHGTEFEVRALLNLGEQVAQLTKEYGVKVTRIADRFQAADENMPFGVAAIVWSALSGVIAAVGSSLSESISSAHITEAEARARLNSDIDARIARLREAGLAPDNTDVYNSEQAVGTVFLNPENRATIESMANRYGLDPALLAGVVAAEMDFDFDQGDYWQDGLGRRDISMGEGQGIANTHTATLDRAIAYLDAHSLPGSETAKYYDKSVINRSSFTGSVESAAIVTSMLVHAKGDVSSPEDMAVVWGAYRTGIKDFTPREKGGGEGYLSLEDFKTGKANGTANLPAEFQIGANAYMSKPYFEYFKEVFGTP